MDLQHNPSWQPFAAFSPSDSNPQRSCYACNRFGFGANADDSLGSQKEPWNSVPKDYLNRVLGVELGWPWVVCRLKVWLWWEVVFFFPQPPAGLFPFFIAGWWSFLTDCFPDKEQLSLVYIVGAEPGEKWNSWFKHTGLCEQSLCSPSHFKHSQQSGSLSRFLKLCGLQGELKCWSITASSLVAWCNKAHAENDAFVLYPTAWFAVTFNLSLDSAGCLIKNKNKILKSAFGGQEFNALQYVGVWGLCYRQTEWLFLFNFCLNIVQMMEYLVEQNRLMPASFFIPVVTRCVCI